MSQALTYAVEWLSAYLQADDADPASGVLAESEENSLLRNGRRRNVWLDPGLWTRCHPPDPQYVSSEVVAVNCLALAMRSSDELTSKILHHYLRTARLEEHRTLVVDVGAAERIFARLEDGEVLSGCRIVTEVDILEQAVEPRFIEDAWLVGRVDLSVTYEDAASSAGGFPDRLHLLVEAKLGGTPDTISVRHIPLAQPAAYAAAWTLIEHSSEAAARVVGTLGIDTADYLGSLLAWRDEAGVKGDNWVAMSDDLDWPQAASWACNCPKRDPAGQYAADLLAVLIK